MEHENNNQVIFLKDLVFTVLYRWKLILAAMLIGAFLLGGLQFIRNANKEPASLSPADSYKIEQLTQQIKAKDDAIANQSTYLQESVLMNLDPYSVQQARVSFYVHTESQSLPDMEYQTPSSIGALLNAYQSLAEDDALTQTLSQVTGISSQFVSELISCTVNSDTNPGVLTITAIHSDAETAIAITDTVKEHLSAATETLSAQLDAHTLSTISTVSGKYTNPQLVNVQKQASDQLTTLNADKAQLQAELQTLSAQTLPTNPILAAFLGAFLGAFLVACVSFAAHLGSTKVYSARTLVNHTGVKVIGSIGKPCCKNPIDRWLKKLEGRAAGDFAQQAAISAAYLRTQCQGPILLTGDCEPEQTEKVAQALRDAGVQAAACGSILRDPKALDALSHASAAVLVEQCRQSAYRNVEQELSILRDTKTTLLGCILLDL